MGFLKKIGVGVAAIGLIGVGLFMVTGHQFGDRPVDSIVKLAAHKDIKFIKANGLNFGYVEMGEGPLVLMFHGYPETLHSWAEVQKQVAAAGYHAVAVATRGYPPTDFADSYNVRNMGDDILALIDAFDEGKAVIIGHDWGASAVYQATNTAPDKIKAMVALSIPHPRGLKVDLTVLMAAPHFLYYQSPFAERLVWSNDFAHIGQIFKEWSPTFDVPQSELDGIIDSFKSPGAIEAAIGYYHSVISDGEENAGAPADSDIKVPSLIIAGDKDGALDPTYFVKSEPAFVNGYSFTLIKNVGHFPQLEAAEETANAIIKFLDDTK